MRPDVPFYRIVAVTTDEDATPEDGYRAFRGAIDHYAKRSAVGAKVKQLLIEGFLKEIEKKAIQVKAREKKTIAAKKSPAKAKPARKVVKKSVSKKPVARKQRPKSNAGEHRVAA